MRSIEDKKLCYNHGPVSVHRETSTDIGLGFEFQHKNSTNIINKSSNITTRSSKTSTNSHSRRSTALGKLSAPSKWDDAQKWLVNLSRKGSTERGNHSNNDNNNNNHNNKPRDSNADDLRLIAPAPQKEPQEEYYNNNNNDISSSEFEEEEEEEKVKSSYVGAKTKKMVDPSGANEVAIWRINKARGRVGVVGPTGRAVCVRDMGTEMTPIASQEPSRTATPVRARSPISSGCSTPIGQQQSSSCTQIITFSSNNNYNVSGNNNSNNNKSSSLEHGQTIGKDLNPLETRAVAWDEAERAKYMARYKREEVKIQAWENHEKRKAEMEMKKMEVKAERIKARAEEKMTNKLAATRRIAEEKRTNAEAKLNEKAMRTSERADYIRRTGHLPSSFSFKLPSLNCW